MGLRDGTSDNMADKNPFKNARRKDNYATIWNFKFQLKEKQSDREP